MKWRPIAEYEVHQDVFDIKIRLTDGSDINTWAQLDGDFWSELLQIFITPDKVTHWKRNNLK